MFRHPKTKQALIGAGFTVIGSTRLHRLLPKSLRGVGAILMFHHVRPAGTEAFRPNGLLEITPDFLDAVIILLHRLHYDIVTLDEAVARMRESGSARRFAVLTFDDGFRDVAVHAAPILARHAAPYTMFITPGFADRTSPLWWVELEEVLRRSTGIEIDLAGESLRLPSATPAQKALAWSAIYARLRQGSEEQLRRALDQLCAQAGIDRARLTASLCLDWDELRRLAASDPLVSFGAHTMSHPRLAKLSPAEMLDEMVESRAVIEARLECRVRHLAYPIGDPTSAGPREFEAARKAGFACAVTTRPGLLFAEHAKYPTALPRLSVNGLYQDVLNLEVLLSGAAFALWNRGRRIDAA